MRKSRHKMRKPIHQRGKVNITKFFQEFKPGDRVALKAEAAYKKGGYNLRYHGKNGVVEGNQGECYTVAIKDGGKRKSLIVHPVHLKKVE